MRVGSLIGETNTRSLAEPAAAERNTLAARGLIAVAARRGARLQLLSRGDSTLRGHVMADGGIAGGPPAGAGSGFDGVLRVSVFLKAG